MELTQGLKGDIDAPYLTPCTGRYRYRLTAHSADPMATIDPRLKACE